MVMQPDQNPAPDYNFIMSPNTSPRKSLFGGASKKQSLLIKLAAAGIVLMLLLLIISTLFSGGGSPTEKMISLAQQQTEIIRLADKGASDATKSEIKNYATTVQLSIITSQKELTKIITGNGGKADAKTLALGKNSKTDDELTAAKQANRYDEVFNEILKKHLSTYQEDVKEVFDQTSSKNDKAVMSGLFNRAKVLTSDTTTN